MCKHRTYMYTSHILVETSHRHCGRLSQLHSLLYKLTLAHVSLSTHAPPVKLHANAIITVLPKDTNHKPETMHLTALLATVPPISLK